MTLHPQYIKDSAGKRMVILSETEYNALVESIQDAEDLNLFKNALTDDDGVRIPLEDAFTQIEVQRKVS